VSVYSSKEESIIASYVEYGEQILLACCAYTNAGLQRRVLGVTDRQMIMVKSHYFQLSDRGLLWADSVDQVALSNNVQYGDQLERRSGNVYVCIRRPNGQLVIVNPRRPGRWHNYSARQNTARLYALVPGRFSGAVITRSWQMLSPIERSSLQAARDLMFAFPGWACWWDPVTYQWSASPPRWGLNVCANSIGELRLRMKKAIGYRDVSTSGLGELLRRRMKEFIGNRGDEGR
jgi:hypothetical protein